METPVKLWARRGPRQGGEPWEEDLFARIVATIGPAAGAYGGASADDVSAVLPRSKA